MTTLTANDRSHESIINDALAWVLREAVGLDAVAETLHSGRRPDILVRLPESPAIIEVEIAPAPTVEADALSRLGFEIDGQKVQNSFAVVVPERLRTTPQQQLYQRLATTSLEWQEWRIDGIAGPKLAGTPAELGAAVSRALPSAGNLEAAVETLDQGARRAGARLFRSPGTLARVARIFGADPSDEVANMAALVIINAMVFQERLASDEAVYQSVGAARRNGQFARLLLLQFWERILDVDYYPIFSMARDVVAEFSEVEASGVLEECAATSADLLGMGAVGRHDVAGRIFNRLIAERKLLAAYYTSIPASTLLAGLALAPAKWTGWDWHSIDAISRMRVVDPACGTGTLLMAAYRQILQNHLAAGGPSVTDPALHRALVEKIIAGADVVQAAIHLTAATLAAMAPSARFEQMQLHTFRLGREDLQGICLGSLDWLDSPEIQSSFSGTQETIGAQDSRGALVPLPRSDLVISNPPYTRRGADGGREDAIGRVFSLPAGDSDSMDAIKRRTSTLLRGTPANQTAGHASSFTVLADRLVNPGGRIALVLPVTALSGESWRGIRQMLASRYDIEFVVSSHDPEQRSMSYDTNIAEILLVARRLHDGESPSGRGRFVNLWRAAYLETDALALVNVLNAAAAAPSLRSDGPPVGGTPLIVGGEQWGEIIDGPVGEGPWTASRWKHALTGQFATALTRGELWTEDGSRLLGNLAVAPIGEVCNVGPQHRQIRGSLGAFDGYHGWNEQAQFPAIWSLNSSVHQFISTEPNAYLIPKPDRNHAQIWSQSGTLHVTPTIRYNSQPIMASCTQIRALGVNTWFTLQVRDDDPLVQSKREIVLAIWCNSTLGMLLQANHANGVQNGRGIGSKGMLETLVTLDVRRLADWQLDEAQAIWRDFREREFQPFHCLAVDPARIELDQRVVGDLLGLGDDAQAAVARLRGLLAVEPSIYGGKRPELAAGPAGVKAEDRALPHDSRLLIDLEDPSALKKLLDDEDVERYLRLRDDHR